ncbi:hypothetical protein T484DRAFT_1884999, partial [Baffinella frigidus]
MSSCECAAGYTGDAGAGYGCMMCEAGTYKDVSGSATCTACPSNAVSAEGSTGQRSCLCRSGYTGEAGAGGNCVACNANTFKPFNGSDACVSCPVNAESAEDGRSCGCAAGHAFQSNVGGVKLSGPCQVTTPGGRDMGLITIPLDFGGNSQSCEWMISGAEPRVLINALPTQSVSVSLDVKECEDAQCMKYSSISANYNYQSGWEYQSAAAHLRVRIQVNERESDRAGCSLAAEWSTTSKPPECSMCEAGTYTDTTDASGCTACPTNAVSAEGSTARSSCECPAGYTGDAGLGQGCVLLKCEAGTYKDVSGLSECTTCPSNAMSLRGSTGLSSCLCPGGYAGDAASGAECVACISGMFKPFNGSAACLSCPGGAVSAEDGTSCVCGAGKIFEHNVPNMTCSGNCPCIPSVGVSEGTMNNVLGGEDGDQECRWVISGAEPSVSITSFDQGLSSSSGNAGYMYIEECEDASCRNYKSLASYQSMRTAAPVQKYTAITGHLRVSFWSSRGTDASFTATWSTTTKPPECSPCEAGTYKDTADASGCTACPKNAVSAEGSTARSSCECAAGYTGSTGVGRVCLACEAGTYQEVGGSAECTACPSNAVSQRGSTGRTSCVCPEGYTGDAGSGEECVACDANKFKPFNGSDACVSCPEGVASTDGGTSCGCGAGHVFEQNVPRVTCSGPCACTSSVGVSTGTMTNVLDGLVGGDPSCTWIISGAEPSVSITSFALGYSYNSGYLKVGECEDASCRHQNQLEYSQTMHIATYEASTGHLRFEFFSRTGSGMSFAASWRTTTKPPECSPCEAGTYKDTTDASGCTACPPNAVSAEGSTDRSSCECAAGYTGDAGAGYGCVLCEAGTYKDVSGSAECTACPSNAMSLRGSTGLSSCFCPGGYAGDAGNGAECVACEAGTFKPFNGPTVCLSCPGNQVSAQGGRSCVCEAGHVFEHNVPSVTCSGSCGCPPSAGVSAGTITNEKEGGFGGNPACTWIISGAEPILSITSFDLGSKTDMTFSAEWSTSIKPPACSLCAAGTYKDSTGASKCTACPCNMISAEGSTALSSCECPAGYTGDAGDSCVLCEAGTYKAVSGSATCTACPSNAMSSYGSTAPSSCFCPGGYTGDAASGASCVDTFKSTRGTGACSSCPAGTFARSGAVTCEQKGFSWKPFDLDLLEDAVPYQFTLFEIYVLVSGEYTASVTLKTGDAGMFQGGNSPLEALASDGATAGVVGFGEATLAVLPDMNGETTWDVAVTDGAEGAAVTQHKEMRITVLAVNDAPSFLVVQSSFFFSHDDSWIEFPFAANLSAGPLDERFQDLSFAVTQVNGPSIETPGATAGQTGGFKPLFDVPPYVTSTGSLRAKLAPALGFAGSGSTSWEVVLKDDGGVEHGGVDSALPLPVEIEVFKRPAKVRFLTLKQELASAGDAEAQTAVEVGMSWDVDGLSNVASFSVALFASTGWNETRHVDTSVCDTGEEVRPCRALFQDLDGIPTGTTLSAWVQAHNAIGSSDAAEAPPGGLLLVGPPSAPETVKITQKKASSVTGGAATRFEVTWSTPSDYGDGKGTDEDRVVLRGYEVTLWCGGGEPSAPLLLSSSYTSLDLAAAWNGDAFVLSGKNSLLNCSKGEDVAVEVRASNFYRGAGPASAKVVVSAMGLPGAVQELLAREVEDGETLLLNVSFHIPADTGFGASTGRRAGGAAQTGAEADGQEVVVHAATCSSFARTASRRRARRWSGYFVRAVFRNLVGESPVEDTPVIIASYFTLPVLTDASTVRVALPYAPGDEFHVWQNGAKATSIALRVFSLPSALNAGDAISAEFRFATETVSKSTTVSASDAVGARSISVPLPTTLPTSCASGCAATLHVHPTSYPNKAVRRPVHFFTYKRPALKSVFPLEGSEQGGSLVSLAVEDYPGDATTPSRFMAGLFSFFDAPALHVE